MEAQVADDSTHGVPTDKCIRDAKSRNSLISGQFRRFRPEMGTIPPLLGGGKPPKGV